MGLPAAAVCTGLPKPEGSCKPSDSLYTE